MQIKGPVIGSVATLAVIAGGVVAIASANADNSVPEPTPSETTTVVVIGDTASPTPEVSETPTSTPTPVVTQDPPPIQAVTPPPDVTPPQPHPTSRPEDIAPDGTQLKPPYSVDPGPAPAPFEGGMATSSAG